VVTLCSALTKQRESITKLNLHYNRRVQKLMCKQVCYLLDIAKVLQERPLDEATCEEIRVYFKKRGQNKPHHIWVALEAEYNIVLRDLQSVTAKHYRKCSFPQLQEQKRLHTNYAIKMSFCNLQGITQGTVVRTMSPLFLFLFALGPRPLAQPQFRGSRAIAFLVHAYRAFESKKWSVCRGRLQTLQTEVQNQLQFIQTSEHNELAAFLQPFTSLLAWMQIELIWHNEVLVR